MFVVYIIEFLNIIILHRVYIFEHLRGLKRHSVFYRIMYYILNWALFRFFIYIYNFYLIGVYAVSNTYMHACSYDLGQFCCGRKPDRARVNPMTISRLLEEEADMSLD